MFDHVKPQFGHKLNKTKIILILSVLLVIVIGNLPVDASEAIDSSGGMDNIKLKILTLNLHSGINWYRKYDLEGIIQFIQEVNPDIVGLQEVDRFWSSASLFQDIPGELALRLKMFSSYSVSLIRNNGYFGNLVLSKYPITLMWAEQLPGILERRSFVLTQVNVNGVKINFATTHLGLSISDRLEQANTILQMTSQISGPLIMAGDFNARLEDEVIKLFKTRFLDVQDLNGSKCGTFRIADHQIGPLIDYIFITPEFNLVHFEVIENYVSDHLPLVVELGLTVDRQTVLPK